MSWIQVKGLTVAFGGPPVLDGVDLVLERGERLCLLGRNGAGKSTLLRALEGALELDDGEILAPPDLCVASLPQEVPATLAGTVYEVVAARAADRAARTAISRIGLDAEADVATLSAGLKRRVLLARAIASDPDLLLLDEPTNHLDVDAIAWLEEFLARQVGALLFVTHDRAFLRRLATGILDLDRGRLTRWAADYDRCRERKEETLDTQARQEALFDKRLAQEEAWIRQGVRERRKRNQGRVRRLEAMRAERQSRRVLPGTVRMAAQAAEASGRIVARVEDVEFAFGERPIVRGLTTTIERGDRVGIVGPNGSGKSTLLELLLGRRAPDRGRVRLGVNLEIAYFDQLLGMLDDDATAADNVTGGPPTVTVNGRSRHVIGYLRDFLFTPDQARSPITAFSGGERARLALARLFARPSNVLVLDEPTNDLDLETLELLEDLLLDYPGTILLVSHDRELLDHVVTSTLVLEGAGTIGEYVGGYSDATRQREEAAAERRRADAAAVQRSGRPDALPDEPRRGGRRGRAPRPRSTLTKEERKELRDLPGRIEALEAERDALHRSMADPAFFQQEGAAIAAAKARLASLEEDLATAYARWETLEGRLPD